MQLPDFIKSFPSLDLPFPADIVTSSAIASDRGLVVIFEFHKDFTIPAHAHKDQWGTVLEGELQLTVAGETKTHTTGGSYFIPAGAEHGASVTAGTKVIDIFAESDRYPLKD